MRREPSIGPHSAAWPSLAAHGVLMFTQEVGFVALIGDTQARETLAGPVAELESKSKKTKAPLFQPP